MDAKFSLKHTKESLEFELVELSSLIGRSANCDIQVDRETLSREHARLTLKNGQVFVQDLHSTNGSFVNEKQIHDITEVKAGDVLRFGQEPFSLQQRDVDATQMFNRSAMEHADSAMLIEDEEEADGTVMLQSISLPAGWSNSDDSMLGQGFENEKEDRALLAALSKHARSKLQHPVGLLVTISSENKAPAVKLFSTEKAQATWYLGRSSDNSLVLDDPRVSVRHALVEFKDKQWRISDSESRNGIQLKGKTIKELAITPKIALEIGPFLLSFEPIKK